MNGIQTISISQLRQHAATTVDKVVTNQQPTIILKRSQPKAVLVDIAYYQALEDAVLDLTDAKEADRAKKEPRTSFGSYLRKRWGKSSV